MNKPYKDLLTIYYNSLVAPRYDWIDGIIVDQFDVVEKEKENAYLDTDKGQFMSKMVPTANAKVRVLTNIEVPDTMTSMEFFEKLGMSPKDFSKVMYNARIEDYIGLPKGILMDELSDIDMTIVTKDEVKSELDERIINVFKTKKPITTLGMF